MQKILENHIYNGKGNLRSIELLARDIINDMTSVEDEIAIDFEELFILEVESRGYLK